MVNAVQETENLLSHYGDLHCMLEHWIFQLKTLGILD